MSTNKQSRHNTHNGNFEAKLPAEYVKELVTFDYQYEIIAGVELRTLDRENIQLNVLNAMAYLLKTHLFNI